MLIASVTEGSAKGLEGRLQRLISGITTGEMDGKLKGFFIFLIVLTVLLTIVDIFINYARVKAKKSRPAPPMRTAEDEDRRKIGEWFARLIGVEFVDEDDEERAPVHSATLPTIDDPEDEAAEAAAVQALREDYDTVPMWEDMTPEIGAETGHRVPREAEAPFEAEEEAPFAAEEEEPFEAEEEEPFAAEEEEPFAAEEEDGPIEAPEEETVGAGDKRSPSDEPFDFFGN